jgi:hypothetical protein
MVGPDRYIIASDNLLYLDEAGGRTEVAAEEGCATAGFDFAAVAHRVVYALRCEERDEEREGVYVYDVRAGSSRKLLSGVFMGVSWSPDGKSLVAAASTPGGGSKETELWFIDARTGELQAREGASIRVQWPDWGVR